jgi:PiT family inorganic phosphate transporter
MRTRQLVAWVIVLAATAISLGTAAGGWRIIKTMGSKLTKLDHHTGFCASTAGSLVVFGASAMGIPVSTTHTITGAIVGVGAARRVSAVRWGLARSIVFAWFVTIPAAAAVAAVAYYAGGLFLT